MKKIVTLNEEDLIRLIKKVINEQSLSLIGKTVNFYEDKEEKNFSTQIKIKNLIPQSQLSIEIIDQIGEKYRMDCDDYKFGFRLVKDSQKYYEYKSFYNKKFYNEVVKQFCKIIPKADFQKP